MTTGLLGRAVRAVPRYSHQAPALRRQAATWGDFARLAQVRLSQSGIGPLVCPHRVTRRIGAPGLGGPVWLRSHTTDVSVFYELTVGHAYDDVVEHAPTRVSSVLDLGGNTGLAARWFATRYPGARVVVVEPDSQNAAAARQNLAPLGSRAYVVEAAVGAVTGTTQLFRDGGEWGFSTVSTPGYDHRPSVTVDVLPVEAILALSALSRVTILKCDIEGAEREVFADCRRWIGLVDCLVIELHDGLTTDEFSETLRSNGATLQLRHRAVNRAHGWEMAVYRSPCAAEAPAA